MAEPTTSTIPNLSHDGKPYASQTIASAFLGPPFVGFIVHLVLYGVYISSFADYVASRTYRRESRADKVLIWVVTVLCSGLTVVVGWQTMLHGLSQDRSVASVYLTSLVDCPHSLLSGLLGALVQTFLALRASRLFGRRKWAKRFFLVAILFVIL